MENSTKNILENIRLINFSMEHASDGIFWLSEEGRILYANAAACTMMGLSLGDLCKKHLCDLCMEMCEGGWDKIWERVKKEKWFLSEARFTVAKGGSFLAEVTSNFVSFEGKEYDFVFIKDISERKSIEGALARSEAHLKSVIDLAVDAIMMGDHEGHIIAVNSKGCEISGRPEEELLGKKIDILFDEEELERVPFRYDLLHKGETVRNERYLTRKDGSKLPIEMNTKMLPDGTYQTFMRDILERKKIEQILKETQITQRQIIDLVPHFIFAKDVAGRFVLVNKTVAKVYGTTVEDLIGKTDADFNPREEEVAHFRSDDLAVIESGEPREIPEEKITDFEGKEHILESIKIPFTLSGSGEKAILGVSVDITDRKKNEEELKKKTKELDNFFWLNLDLLCIAGVDGTFKRLNGEWERTLGYTIKELEGKRFFDLIHPDDIAATLGVVDDLKDQKDVLNFVNRYRRKDGSYRWIEWRSTAVGGEIYAAARDVTEQRSREEEAIKSAEQTARQQGALLEMAKLDKSDFEKAVKVMTEKAAETLGIESVSVWFFDESREKLLCQDMYRRSENKHFIADPLEVKKYPLYFERLGKERLIKVDDAFCDPVVAEFVESYLKPHNVFSLVDVPIWRNGKMIGAVCHEAVGKKRIWTEHETDFAGAVSDMVLLSLEATERKKLEDAIMGKNKELESFVYTVSHDLKSPLVSFYGFLEYLVEENKGKLDKKSEHIVERLFANVKQMENLIHDLLELSRVGKSIGKKESALVRDIFKEVADRFSVQVLDKKIKVVIESDDECRIFADIKQIEQALSNLMDNAIKFMGNDGEKIVTLRCNSDKRKVRLVVKDTGIGIAEEFQGKIFDVFYRHIDSKHKVDGTGIGLSIVKKIAEGHRGSVGVISSSGKGAEFWIELPQYEN